VGKKRRNMLIVVLGEKEKGKRLGIDYMRDRKQTVLRD